MCDDDRWRILSQNSAGREGEMKSDAVSVLEGNTFVVARRNGGVDAGPGEPPEGTFDASAALVAHSA
jgi:hypothetical protein